MLYELFNHNMFYVAVRAANANLDMRLGAMRSLITEHANEAVQMQQWIDALSRFSTGITRVAIDGAGSHVPPAIVPILNDVLGSLTEMDFRRRPYPLTRVRELIWSAIRVLSNERDYQRRLTRMRDLRHQRIEKALEKDRRIRTMLARHRPTC
jgi:hypothetical protein